MVLNALDVQLGDEAQFDARYGLFGDSANLDAIGAWFCAEHTTGSKNHFGHTR
jgi:hypothetical protein